MKICILCAVIMILLRSDACADETNQNNLITTYDPGQAIESQNFPRRVSSVRITADDKPHHHPKHNGHVKFEGQSPERPIKFEDDPKKHGYIDNNKADPGSLLTDVSSNDSENKIKFEGSDEEQEINDDQENNDEEGEPKNARQIVFEDDGKVDEDFDYLDVSETKVETVRNPIKFENQDNESYYNNRDSKKKTVTKKVVFKDDSYYNQVSNQKRKRKQRRKPGFQGKPTDPAATAQNSPYLGYPGAGYPGPAYPGPGDPNAGYQSYPTPGYPTPGNLSPNYPNPYAGTAYPTIYPGYSPYPPGSLNPGYGAYPNPGYQVQGDQRPPANPVAYPSPVQGYPSGVGDTRYPNQEYAGSLSSGAPPPSAPQGVQQGPLYPGQKYGYYQGYPVPGYPPGYPSDPNSQYPPQNQAQYVPPVYPGAPQHGYQSGPQRPSRRPKSLTHRAVSAVAEALTSIALYDDYQCVPRILCEVAGGSTSSPTLLKASASLQPLLSLLQVYNGVSSSPLFIFGHAAVTGMTAKGNPAACHRAYPQCPTEPEKLINYLNNHNGGFFRFFGQPEAPQQQQNLEQFYNYLSGQNVSPQQNYGYGFPRPYGYGFLHQNPYAHPAQPYNYGQNYYNENIGYRDAKKNYSEVEGRIQNKPAHNAIEAESDFDFNDYQDDGSKWSFPGEYNERDKVKIRPERRPKPDRPPKGSKTLKFPDDRSDDRREVQMIRDYPRREKHIYFPEQSHFQIRYTNYQTTTPVNSEDYYFDHKHNFYVKRPNALTTDDVVYVVRGNGDPNHPEIVRVRPGQKI